MYVSTRNKYFVRSQDLACLSACEFLKYYYINIAKALLYISLIFISPKRFSSDQFRFHYIFRLLNQSILKQITRHLLFKRKGFVKSRKEIKLIENSYRRWIHGECRASRSKMQHVPNKSLISLLPLYETDSNVGRLKYFAVTKDFIANISGTHSRVERLRELYTSYK